MSATDKAKNKAQEVKGKAKETTGKAVGNERLEAEGVADQTAARRQAGRREGQGRGQEPQAVNWCGLPITG